MLSIMNSRIRTQQPFAFRISSWTEPMHSTSAKMELRIWIFFLILFVHGIEWLVLKFIFQSNFLWLPLNKWKLFFSDKTCLHLLNQFEESHREYIQCVINNSEPVKLCTGCVVEYKQMVAKYNAFLNGTNSEPGCRANFIDLDQLNPIQTIFDGADGLWKKGACSGKPYEIEYRISVVRSNSSWPLFSNFVQNVSIATRWPLNSTQPIDHYRPYSRTSRKCYWPWTTVRKILAMTKYALNAFRNSTFSILLMINWLTKRVAIISASICAMLWVHHSIEHC